MLLFFTWFIIVFALIGIIFIAIEWLTADKQRNQIYEKCKNIKRYIEKYRIRDYPNDMALIAIEKIELLWTQYGLLSFLSFSAVFSILFTAIGFNLGKITAWFSSDGALVKLNLGSTTYLAYFINYIFDSLTILFSYIILIQFPSASFFKKLLLLKADIIIALLLFAICFTSLYFGYSTGSNHKKNILEKIQEYSDTIVFIGTNEERTVLIQKILKNADKLEIKERYDFIQTFISFPLIIKRLINNPDNAFSHKTEVTIIDKSQDPIKIYNLVNFNRYDITALFVAGTTILPTLAFLTMLLLMVYSRSVFLVIRWLAYLFFGNLVVKNSQEGSDHYEFSSKLWMPIAVILAIVIALLLCKT